MYVLVKCWLRTNSFGLTVSIISCPAEQSYVERISVQLLQEKRNPVLKNLGLCYDLQSKKETINILLGV